MTATMRSPLARETIVSRWVEAFNARELDVMLLDLDPDVRFHPLRLSGLRCSYRGHAGVREWFGALEHTHCEPRTVLAEVLDVGAGNVLALGSLRLAGQRDVGSFGALHGIHDGLIRWVHHYLTDPEALERLGLIP